MRPFVAVALCFALAGCVDVPIKATGMRPSAPTGQPEGDVCGSEYISFPLKHFDWVALQAAATLPTRAKPLMLQLRVDSYDWGSGGSLFLSDDEKRAFETKMNSDTYVTFSPNAVVRASWEGGGHAELPLFAPHLVPTPDGRVYADIAFPVGYEIPGFTGDWIDMDVPAITVTVQPSADPRVPKATPVMSILAGEETVTAPRIRFTRTTETKFISIRCR